MIRVDLSDRTFRAKVHGMTRVRGADGRRCGSCFRLKFSIRANLTIERSRTEKGRYLARLLRFLRRLLQVGRVALSAASLWLRICGL